MKELVNSPYKGHISLLLLYVGRPVVTHVSAELRKLNIWCNWKRDVRCLSS
jgi:hypothetical protein